jgi:hypothetical protein
MDDRIRWYGSSHHRAGANHGTAPNCDTMKDNCPRPDPYIILNDDAAVVLGPFLHIGHVPHETADKVGTMVSAADGDFRAKHHMIADANLCPRRHQNRA